MPAKTDKKAGIETFDSLHAATARYMLDQFESGEPLTPAFLSAVVKFLQNNQIVVDTSGSEGSPLDKLRRMSLPSFDDVEDLDKEEKWN